MCSAVVLTSLTAATQQVSLTKIQQRMSDSLSGVSARVGSVLGVATIAAGGAALAYQKSSSGAILHAVVAAANNMVSPEAFASAQNMVRSNYMWIEGYRWAQNTFRKWLY